MKKTTHQFLKGSFDKLSAIRVQAEKLANSGVRKKLEEMYPELKKLNPKMQEDIWLKEGVERTVKNLMERPMLPGGGLIKGIINDTIDHPLVKARIGIALNRTNKIKKFSPKSTIFREVAYQENELKDAGQIP